MNQNYCTVLWVKVGLKSIQTEENRLRAKISRPVMLPSESILVLTVSLFVLLTQTPRIALQCARMPFLD